MRTEMCCWDLVTQMNETLARAISLQQQEHEDSAVVWLMGGKELEVGSVNHSFLLLRHLRDYFFSWHQMKNFDCEVGHIRRGNVFKIGKIIIMFNIDKESLIRDGKFGNMGRKVLRTRSQLYGFSYQFDLHKLIKDNLPRGNPGIQVENWILDSRGPMDIHLAVGPAMSIFCLCYV